MSDTKPALALPVGMRLDTGASIPLQPRELYSADEIAEASAKQPEVSFGQAWDAANYEASTIQATARHMNAAEDATVSDYQLPDEGTPEHEELMRDVPESRREEFSLATGPESALRIKKNIIESEKAGQTLAQFGGFASQFWMRGLAAITDPGTLALGLATAELGGVGFFSRASLGMSRAYRLSRVGAISAVENAALERYLQTSYSEHSLEGPAYAALLGFAIGGGLSAAPRGLTKAMADASESALQAADNAALRSAGLADADHAGAAGTGGLQRNLVTGMNENDGIPRTTNNAARLSIASSLGDSESGAARSAGQLVEDAIGTTSDGSARPIPATHRQQVLMNQHAVEMYRAAKPAFNEWLKEQGLGFWKRFDGDTIADYMNKVTNAIENGTGSAAEMKTARAINESMRKMLNAAKEAGVPGADRVTHASDHVPHIWKTTELSHGRRVYRGGVEELFTQGLLKAAGGSVTEAQAKRMAKSMVTTIARAGAGMEYDLSHVFTKDGLSDLKGMLVDSGMKAEDADSVIYPFLKEASEEGSKPTTRLRQRALIDPDVKLDLLNHETGVLDSVSLKQFMERNAERLHNVYVRQLSGRVALAKAGIKDYAQFQKLIETARAELDAAGKMDAIPDTVERMEFVWKAVTGAPLEANPLSLGSKAGRALNHFNFMRLMNQMGLSQAADAAHLLSENGVATTLMHIPALKDMFTRMKDGTFRIENDLANEWEALGLSGSDILRQSMSVHAAPDTDMFYGNGAGSMGKSTVSSLAHKGLDKFETVSHHGRRVTNQISMFAGINTALHRMAGRVVAQKFLDLSMGEKVPNLARLKTIGLDEPLLSRVLAEVKTNFTTEDSIFGAGRKVRKMNIDKWTDREAADAFTHAAYAMGRRIIQENDVGVTAMWMHSTTGKILTQFRGFQIGAWEKNTLHNWNMKDWQTASTWMLGTTTATAMYMFRTYINSIGRDDQQAHLQKELSLSKIARSGYGMSAWSSIVPMTVDTAWMFTGGEAPLLGRASSSGLQHGILGIPAVDLMYTKLPSAAQGVRNAVLPGNEMTRQQARDLASLVLWSNATGIRNFIQNVTQDMPKQARSRYEKLWYNE